VKFVFDGTATITRRELSAISFTTIAPMNVFGIAGWSGSGKTTLIEHLLPLLVARGLRVSVVKHAHHKFDIDKPGKDSYRFREAGSHEVLISSPARWALMREHRGVDEPGLDELLSHLSDCDLVLVEGFKRDNFPKLEIHRAENGKPLLHSEDPGIVAIATDTALPQATVPVVDLNDIEAIADLLLKYAVPVSR
jgi:molybdopterin-guanine dinucleotide biosynthesis protein B